MQVMSLGGWCINVGRQLSWIGQSGEDLLTGESGHMGTLLFLLNLP